MTTTTAHAPATPDTGRIGGPAIRVAVLCALVVLFDGLDGQIMGFLGPAVAREWHLSAAELGRIFAAGQLGMMAGLLVIGPFADRIGRKWPIVLSLVLLGLCTLLTATARGPGELLLYRFAVGVGLGGTLPNALALTGDYCPDRRKATLLTVMFTGFSLGAILGGSLTAALISQYGWRTVFVVAGILPLATTPLLIRMLPDSVALLRRERDADRTPVGSEAVSGKRTTPVRTLFAAGRSLGTVLLWIAFFMSLMEIYFQQSWLPTTLANAGYSLAVAALAATLISVGGIGGGLLCGPLMDRFGRMRVLALFYVVGALAVPLVTTMPTSLAICAAAIFSAGFCVGGAQKGLNAAAVIFYPPPARATGAGWALGAGRIGAILGPLLVGWLMSRNWPASDIYRAASLPMLFAAAAMLAMARSYGGSVLASDTNTDVRGQLIRHPLRAQAS